MTDSGNESSVLFGVEVIDVEADHPDEMSDQANFGTSFEVIGGGEGVVVERLMRYASDGAYGAYLNAHASMGGLLHAGAWEFSEGAARGPSEFETFLVISNPSQGVAPNAADLRVEVFPQESEPIAFDMEIPRQRRATLALHQLFPPNIWTQSFSFRVSHTDDPVPIVVERVMYWKGRQGAHSSFGKTTAIR